MIGKLRTPSRLVDEVYRAVLQAISDGSLAAGERVTQDGLADALGVSRQPVAQALAVLERQGFVQPAGRQGLKVAELNSRFVSDLFDVRAALDGTAARSAAAKSDEELASRGRSLMDALRRAGKSGSAEDFFAAVDDLHGFLYDTAGNHLLKELAEPYRSALTQLSLRAGEAEHRHDIIVLVEALWEAVQSGDAAGAEEQARKIAADMAERLNATLVAKNRSVA